ncbi:hypothetical protein ACWEPZ_31595 [Streptomyces sp. NPDC004288]
MEDAPASRHVLLEVGRGPLALMTVVSFLVLAAGVVVAGIFGHLTM